MNEDSDQSEKRTCHVVMANYDGDPHPHVEAVYDILPRAKRPNSEDTAPHGAE